MTDDKLRLQLEILIDQDLRDMATAAGANTLTELCPWIAKLKQLDIKRQTEMERWKTMCQAAVHEAKRPNLGNGFLASNGNQTNASRSNGSASNARSSSSTQTNKTYPPKLMTEERQLLFDHEGCLRCHVFYARHHANQCQMVLSGTNYKTHTLQDALRAKAKSSRPAPVAAITDTFSMSFSPDNDLVAAVFPPGSSSTADKSLSDSSEASLASVSITPPLKGKHLIWSCILNNDADTISVKADALIDSGSHMALIHPDLVSRLKLQSYKLAHPERVSVAMGSSALINKLTHYVIIEPTSIDRLFTSHHIHAVIALGLCMPLILGLPFLTSNKVICNYADRTCLATRISPAYDLLKPLHARVSTQKYNTPDTLAALGARIKGFSIDEEYAARNAEMHLRFARIFEPPPPTLTSFQKSHLHVSF